MIILIISYMALAIEWLVALLQSVLFYSEIAVAGLFVGFLLVPGLQNIAKGFLLSFVAISLWPIALLIVGLVTRFVISIGTNSSEQRRRRGCQCSRDELFLADRPGSGSRCRLDRRSLVVE